jgi:hypothetical protein
LFPAGVLPDCPEVPFPNASRSLISFCDLIPGAHVRQKWKLSPHPLAAPQS